MSDLISRQAAIQAAERESKQEGSYGYMDTKSIIDMLEDLPSAQSEVYIRHPFLTEEERRSAKEYCIECNHIEMCGWHPFEGCEFRDLPKPERKKGLWRKVSGYVTPGGDSVWCCSECGKGLHVYGVEHGSYGSDVADHQWVACPNCGAEMKGDHNG